MSKQRTLTWIGSSLKEARTFPEDVKDGISYSLHLAQEDLTPLNVKALKGFKPLVMEIKDNSDNATFRAVYTAKLGNEIYVLHCFQKKSKTGIKTTKKDVDLIKRRLREAENLYKLTHERKPECVPIE